jgi:hypothetical protein
MPHRVRLLIAVTALAATSCGAATELPGDDGASEPPAEGEPGATVEVSDPPEEPTVHEASEDEVRCSSFDGWYHLELDTGELRVVIDFGSFTDTGDPAADAKDYPDPEVVLGINPPCEGCSFTNITEGEATYSNAGLECMVTARVVAAMVDASFECEGLDDQQQRRGTFSGAIRCRAQPRG